MSSMSKSMYIGRLTRDPQLKYVKVDGQDTAVVNFTVAVDGEGGQSTDYYNIVAWRGLAETIAKYLTQGRLVYVEGRSRTRKYSIEKEGVTFDNYVTETHATRVDFLDRAPKTEEATATTAVGVDSDPW